MHDAVVDPLILYTFFKKNSIVYLETYNVLGHSETYNVLGHCGTLTEMTKASLPDVPHPPRTMWPRPLGPHPSLPVWSISYTDSAIFEMVASVAGS